MISSLQLGGAERQLTGLALALKEAGHDVEVLTYHEGNFYEDFVMEHGIRHTHLEIKTGRGIVKSLTEHIRQEGCDILISFKAGTNIRACNIGRRIPGLRVIVSERNCNLGMHLHDAFRFSHYRRAELVVCNNFSQEIFIRHHFPSLGVKLRTIPNYVDVREFSPFDRPACDQRRIIVTARVCRRKNVLGLIEAAGILAKGGAAVQFDWFGADRPTRYLRKCRERITQLGLSDSFRIHKALKHTAEAYRNADFFCLPSFYEGTSNSLAEALACGLPVICSRVSDNPRYAVEGSNGFLFNPSDYQDMARVIRTALSTPESTLDLFRARSRSRAEELLDWEAFKSGWTKLLG